MLVSPQNMRKTDMPYTPELMDELNVLIRYNLKTTQEGIIVHKTADSSVIAAVSRLHGKGLVMDEDGGYLTDLGREAAEHAEALELMLRPL